MIIIKNKRQWCKRPCLFEYKYKIFVLEKIKFLRKDDLMKVKEGYRLREIAGETIVVSIGGTALNFKEIITLNETGAFLWKQLENECHEEILLKHLLEEYDVDTKTATSDIQCFLNKMRQADLLDE